MDALIFLVNGKPTGRGTQAVAGNIAIGLTFFSPSIDLCSFLYSCFILIPSPIVWERENAPQTGQWNRARILLQAVLV